MVCKPQGSMSCCPHSMPCPFDRLRAGTVHSQPPLPSLPVTSADQPRQRPAALRPHPHLTALCHLASLCRCLCPAPCAHCWKKVHVWCVHGSVLAHLSVSLRKPAFAPRDGKEKAARRKSSWVGTGVGGGKETSGPTAPESLILFPSYTPQ